MIGVYVHVGAVVNSHSASILSTTSGAKYTALSNIKQTIDAAQFSTALRTLS